MRLAWLDMRRLLGHATALAGALVRQAAIQLAMALGGILIVRALDIDAYAHYAIAFSMLTAAAAISNSGIIDGLTSLAAPALDDGPYLDRIAATAFALRRRIALGLACILVPILALLLHRNGAGIPEIVMLIGSVAAINGFELFFAVAMIIPWLRGLGGRVQEAELCGALLRLAAIGLLVGSVPSAPSALFCGIVGIGTQLYLLRRLAPVKLGAGPPDPEIKRSIMRLVHRQWPNELNALVQAQAALWLLTLFGGTTQVALYAALARVNILFSTVLNALHRTIGGRYAVAQERPKILRRYGLALGVFLLLAASLLLAVAVLTRQILWVLGPRYADAATLLRLSALAGAIGAFADLTLWLNAMRGWIIAAWISVPYQAACLFGLCWFYGAHSADAVLHISIGIGLAQSVINIAYFRRTISRLKA